MKYIVDGVPVEMTEAEIAEFNGGQRTEADLIAMKWQDIRSRRDELLKKSDWIVTKALETGVAIPDDWKNYRQALRDLPANTTDIANPPWPTLPT